MDQRKSYRAIQENMEREIISDLFGFPSSIIDGGAYTSCRDSMEMDIAALDKAIKKFHGDFWPKKSFAAHPDIRPFIERQFHKIQAEVYRPLSGSIPIHFTEKVPAYQYLWYPPKGSKFCTYGPEDESWMRPLGIGRIEKVPQIWSMSQETLLLLESVLDFETIRTSNLLCNL